MREVSNPIAIDGQIWSLEIDLNTLVKNYISLFLVSTNCAALKLDPAPLCQIKLILVHPKEPHASIKKTLKVESKPSHRYRFLRFAKIDEVHRLGYVGELG